MGMLHLILLLSLFYSSCPNYCYKRPFPYIISGNTKDVDLFTLAIDSNFNIVVGGSFIDGTGNDHEALIIKYDKDGNTKWMKLLEPGTLMISVKISPNNQYILAVYQNNSRLSITIIDSEDGTIMYSYENWIENTQIGSIAQDAALIDNDLTIYLGISTISSLYVVKKYNINGNDPIGYIDSYYFNKEGQPFVLMKDKRLNIIYVGGYFKLYDGTYSDTPTTNYHTNLVALDADNLDPIRGLSYSATTNHNIIVSLDQFEISPTSTQVVGCMHFSVSDGNDPISLLKAHYNPFATSQFENYQSYSFYLDYNLMRCRGIYQHSLTDIYISAELLNTEEIKILKVNFETNEYSIQLLPLQGTLRQTKFISNTQAYYVGFIETLSTNSNTQLFTPKAGFINSINHQENCLDSITQSDTTYPFTFDPTIPFGYNSQTKETLLSTTQLTASTITIGDLSIETPLDQSFCMNDQQIIDFISEIQYYSVQSNEEMILLNLNTVAQLSCTSLSYQIIDLDLGIQASNIFQIEQQKVKVLTTNTQDVGSYNLQVIGSINNVQVVTVQLIVKIISLLNSPPYFTLPLQDQIIIANQVVTYTLPEVRDDEGDEYTKLIIRGFASSFVSVIDNKLKIKPNNNDVGTYEIFILLTDKNKILQQSRTYFFKIFVLKEEIAIDETPIEPEEQAEDHQNQEDEISEQPNNQANEFVPNIQSNINENLEAKINSISRSGQVEVSFNSNIIIPSDFQQFNDTILLLEIIPGTYQDISKLGFTWKITYFSTNSLTIDLTFDNTLHISQGKERDQLRITFVQNGYFKEANSNKAIKVNYKTQSAIPAQVQSEKVQDSLEKIGNALSGGGQLTSIVSITINMAMSGSLQFLWGMINALQLIVHVPLFSINFPSNAVTVFSILMQIAGFDVIPDGYISKVINFKETDPYNDEFDELDIFQIFINLFQITLTIITI